MTLFCAAGGNPTPSISWIKDGSVLSVGSRISFGADNKELIIRNVGKADRGQYRCVASNSFGNATSNAATLDVQCKYRQRTTPL